MNNVKGFKMINGVDLIANILEETTTLYKLENAMYYELVKVDESKLDVQFAPLTYGAKLPVNQNHPAMQVELSKTSVLFSYEIRDEITERLRKIVSPILLLDK